MTASEIHDLILTWREENGEFFQWVNYDPKRLARTGILHIMVGPRPERAEEAMSMCRGIAQYFQEKTGHEVWLQATLFYHSQLATD